MQSSDNGTPAESAPKEEKPTPVEIKIGEHEGKVFMEFSVPVAWVTFDKEKAKLVGETLIMAAQD